MKHLGLVGFALLGCMLGSANHVTNNVKGEELDTKIVVQLKGSVKDKSASEIAKQQNLVLRQIASNITTSYKIETRFTNVLSGFVLEINSAHVNDIKQLPGVKNVEYSRMLTVKYKDEAVDTREGLAVTEERDNISAKTMNVPLTSNQGEGTLIAILDTGAMINATINGVTGVTHNTFADLDSSVKLKVTQESIQQKIASAPSFHGKKDAEHSTYWNKKVPFYYDYGGETKSMNGDSSEDYDVYDAAQPHGNHCATIAAGNDPYYKGIAPKAQLAIMKVFTTFNVSPEEAEQGYTASFGATNNNILKAIEDCAVIGADVISLSLGSTLNDFDDDSIINNVIADLQNSGTYINFAAGNDGKNIFEGSAYEYWTTDMVETGILSSHVNRSEVMAVAACQADEEYYESAFVVGNKTVSFEDQITNYTTTDGEVTYNPERRLTDLLIDHPDGVFEWIKIGGWGEEADYEDKDTEGKIVIVDRGETTFLSKIQTAVKHGAIAVGIINNDPTDTDFSFRMDLSGSTPSVPVISILFRDKEVFEQSGITTCKLLQNTEAANPTARTTTTFTTDGPTHDFKLKPDVSTPGQAILGGVYGGVDEYEYYDGTSMATPNYSGAVALLLGEHPNDPQWTSSINNRLMSTAKPMIDKFGTNYDSVRRQGAGLVDVTSAINTSVYLDGSTSLGNLTNKAKIELFNNADISKGNVKLSFSAINTSSNNIEYKAETYIYRPELVELDAEQFPDFVGTKLQATYNHLIAKTEQNVTVNANSQTLINLNTFTISGEEKKTIDDNFENGCYIEGYVILKADGQETLTIPFLGFYGDPTGAIPVEPFRFERDENKIYQSDVLNNLAKKFGGHSLADFASDWVYGNYTDMSRVALDDFIYSEKGLRDCVDSNAKKLNPIGIDPYTGKINKDKLFVGNNGLANTMIISQFVLRSVKTNTLTLTHKGTGDVVLVDHMFDSLYGEENGTWPLFKSHACIDYWSAGIIAHRAYTIIPLYEYEELEQPDGSYKYKVGDLYPDGEYDVDFDYELVNGGTYHVRYTINIDSSKPYISGLEQSEDKVRVRFQEDNLSYVAVNGTKYAVNADDNGFYYDVNKKDLTNNKVFIKGTDTVNSSSSNLFHIDDVNEVILTNDNLAMSYDFVTNIEDTDNGQNVAIELTKSGKAATVKGDITVTFKSSLEDVSGLKIYNIDSKGNKTEANYQTFNGYVSFVCNSLKFETNMKVLSQPVGPLDPEESSNPESESSLPNSSSENGGSKGGCGGSVIAASGIISIVSALGICLMSAKKRKED